jgi:predicted P-loop ATPase
VSLRPDPEEIRRAVDLFLKPGTVLELRVPKAGNDGTISGYFSDPEKLTQAAISVNGKGPGVYITLNEIPPEALLRCSNRIKTRALSESLTTDKDITRRRWLFLDFDPPRVSGISSTDTEHEAGIAAARYACASLSRWPAPVLADSGNGGHLLYAIDLPNDESSRNLLKKVLSAAAQRFTTPRVKVDQTVHNASRISKLYGTVAAKGEPDPDRPHRVSRILDMPDVLEPVSIELLQELAAEVFEEPPRHHEAPHAGQRLDARTFLNSHGIAFRDPVQVDGSDKYVLEHCPFNPAHNAPDSAVFQRQSGALGFICLHDSCHGKKWADLRALFDPAGAKRAAEYKDRPAQRVNGHAAAAPEPEDEPEPSPEPTTDHQTALTAETARIIEAKDLSETTGVYCPAFIRLCVRAGSIATFAARQALKKAFGKDLVLKGVPGAWDVRIQEETNRYSKPKSDPEDWQSRLIRRENGNPAPCVTNALLYFENHEDWAGKLAWNEFTGEPLVKGDMPDPVNLTAGEAVRDHHDTLVQSWLERETYDYKWNIDTVRRSADVWAKAHSFNPVKDYLNGLAPWDGVRRLNRWLFDYCGAGPAEVDDTTDSIALASFISAIGQRWWISAIARVFEPGCKVHHVLVLEGAKGIGKTTLAEIIFGEWYAVILGDVTTKDNQALMSAGVWGVLMDELDVLGKSEMRSVKSWVTRDFEKFRPTWGHRHEKRPRQCVFIATVNGSDWALEEDRRWWPVACRKMFDLDGLRAQRDNLMAEALYLYRANTRWYLHAEEDAELINTAKLEQAARVPEDTWHGLVKRAVDKVKEQTSVERISGRRGIFLSKEDIVDALPDKYTVNRDVAGNRVGRAMKGLNGWTRIQITTTEGARPWRYYLPWE